MRDAPTLTQLTSILKIRCFIYLIGGLKFKLASTIFYIALFKSVLHLLLLIVYDSLFQISEDFSVRGAWLTLLLLVRSSRI